MGESKGDSSKSLKSTVAAKWFALSRVKRCGGEEEGGADRAQISRIRATTRALLGSLLTTGLNGVGMKI